MEERRPRPVYARAAVIVLVGAVQSGCGSQPSARVADSAADQATQAVVEHLLTYDRMGRVAAARDGAAIYRGSTLGRLDLQERVLSRLSQARAPTSIAVSWDDTRVAYTLSSPDGVELRIVSSAGGDDQLVGRYPVAQRYPSPVVFDWTPNGTELIVADPDGIVALDIATGAERIIVPDSELSPGWPEWPEPRVSPDGIHLVYESGGRVHIADLDGLSSEPLLNEPRFSQAPIWTPDGNHVVFIGGENDVWDLWAVPVVGGNATGRALRLVEGMGGSRFRSLGLGTAGQFLFARYGRFDDVYTVAPASGGLLRPEPLGAGAGPNRAGTWSPDGLRYAFLTKRPLPDSAPTSNVWRPAVLHHEAGAAEIFDLGSDPVDLYQDLEPEWSPDGRLILFDLMEGIYWLDLEEGDQGWFVGPSEGRQPEGCGDWPCFRTFGWLGGDTAVYGRFTDGEPGRRTLSVRRRELVTGADEEIWTGSVIGARRLSPDGRFLTLIEDHTLALLDLKDGSRRTVLEAPWFEGDHVWTLDGAGIVVAGQESAAWPPRVNFPFRFEGYPLDEPPGQDTFSFRPPLERLASAPEPDSTYYSYHPIRSSSFWMLSIATGELEPLGDVRLLDGNETLGARAISVHPSSEQIAFTAGGTFYSVWMMEGVLARLASVIER